MIERITRTTAVQSGSGPARTGAAGGFGQAMARELAKTQAEEQRLAFSRHAMTRAEQRGIEVTPALLEQLSGSVAKAQEKGATNILAMDANRAFLINIPNARVITAITQEEMKENIFTNIDGAVFL